MPFAEQQIAILRASVVEMIASGMKIFPASFLTRHWVAQVSVSFAYQKSERQDGDHGGLAACHAGKSLQNR